MDRKKRKKERKTGKLVTLWSLEKIRKIVRDVYITGHCTITLFLKDQEQDVDKALTAILSIIEKEYVRKDLIDEEKISHLIMKNAGTAPYVAEVVCKYLLGEK